MKSLENEGRTQQMKHSQAAIHAGVATMQWPKWKQRQQYKGKSFFHVITIVITTIWSFCMAFPNSLVTSRHSLCFLCLQHFLAVASSCIQECNIHSEVLKGTLEKLPSPSNTQPEPCEKLPGRPENKHETLQQTAFTDRSTDKQTKAFTAAWCWLNFKMGSLDFKDQTQSLLSLPPGFVVEKVIPSAGCWIWGIGACLRVFGMLKNGPSPEKPHDREAIKEWMVKDKGTWKFEWFNAALRKRSMTPAFYSCFVCGLIICHPLALDREECDPGRGPPFGNNSTSPKFGILRLYEARNPWGRTYVCHSCQGSHALRRLPRLEAISQTNKSPCTIIHWRAL